MVTLPSVPSKRTGIEIDFGIESRCIRCGAEREPEGRKVLQLDATFIVQAEQPCECGERRIKVSWSFGVSG